MPKRSRKNTNNIQNSPRNKINRVRKSEFATTENPIIFLDKINIEIVRNIIKNPDIKSSEISEKIDIPLSTVQRRRSKAREFGPIEKEF